MMLSTGKDSVISTNKVFISKSVAGQRTQLLSLNLLGDESSVKNILPLAFLFLQSQGSANIGANQCFKSPAISAVQQGRLLVLTQAQLTL